jgi:guanylate kinase
VTAALFVCGPSGVGKSLVVHRLVRDHGCAKIVTTTTRAPRTGERHGVHYHFTTVAEFEEMERSGGLLISDRVFGVGYGIENSELARIREGGRFPVCELHAPHIRRFLGVFPGAIAVYLRPSSLQLIASRMRSRGDSPVSVATRLSAAEAELKALDQDLHPLFARTYLITDGSVDPIVTDIETNLPDWRRKP